MKNNFDYCLKQVLKDEGGYSNDPSDSGGATNFGITIADYKKYINSEGTPDDVRNMTVAQAGVIYKTRYWDALDCDNLPGGTDYTVFDYGVNSGLGRPRKALQTFKSLSGTKLIDAINDERTAFLQALATRRPKDQRFLRGWMLRVERVRAASKVLAGQKNTIAGSTAGAVTVGGTAALVPGHFWVLHPYWTSIGVVAVAIAVACLVHAITNSQSVTGVTTTSSTKETNAVSK